MQSGIKRKLQKIPVEPSAMYLSIFNLRFFHKLMVSRFFLSTMLSIMLSCVDQLITNAQLVQSDIRMHVIDEHLRSSGQARMLQAPKRVEISERL